MVRSTWNIDPSHTSIAFTARHMVITKVRGVFTGVRGAIQLDEFDITGSRVDVAIDASTITTHEPKRDEHLRSADFFDVERFPEITFKSTGIVRDGDELLVEGDLAIHGVSRPIRLAAKMEGRGKDPWGGERIAFMARTSLIREQFGLKWNQALEAGGWLISSKIDVELDVQAVKAA